MNFSILCTILVIFSPETPEFTLLTKAPFAVIRQKSAYHVKYLRISWTYLDLLYKIGRRIGGDDYSNVRSAVAIEPVIFTPCPPKNKQICFCQNFVKFSPILIIFSRKMGNDPNICQVHSFSTSPICVTTLLC